MANNKELSGIITEKMQLRASKQATRLALQSVIKKEEQYTAKGLDILNNLIEIEQSRIVKIIRDDALEVAQYAQEHNIHPKRGLTRTHYEKLSFLEESIFKSRKKICKNYWFWRINETEIDKIHAIESYDMSQSGASYAYYDTIIYKTLDLETDGTLMVKFASKSWDDGRFTQRLELDADDWKNPQHKYARHLAEDSEIVPIESIDLVNSDNIISEWRERLSSLLVD